MQLTLCREVRYDTWFKPMVIKLLKKLGEVKVEVQIYELLLKEYEYEGNFRKDATTEI